MSASPRLKDRRRTAAGTNVQPGPLLIAARCRPAPLIQAAWQTDPTRRGVPLTVVSAGERVLAVCPGAAATGVRTGQRLAQARMACPDLVWAPPDWLAAGVLYEDLLAGLSSLSPVIEAHDAQAGLAYLDGGGLDRLIGEPPALVQAVIRAGAAVGIALRAGAGPSRLLARLASERGDPARGSAHLAPRDAWRLLHAVPLTDPLFALPPPVLAWCAEVGLRTAGGLAALPRAALTLRFDSSVTALWDVLNGALEPPLCPWSPPAVLTARHADDDGLADRPGQDVVLGSLADTLLGQLRGRGQATAQLTLRVAWMDGTRRLSRSRHWPPLVTSGPLGRAALALLDRAHQPPRPAPIQALRLEAGELGTDRGIQTPLFGDPLTARQGRLTAVLSHQAARHGGALLGRWRPDPCAPDDWTWDGGTASE